MIERFSLRVFKYFSIKIIFNISPHWTEYFKISTAKITFFNRFFSLIHISWCTISFFWLSYFSLKLNLILFENTYLSLLIYITYVVILKIFMINLIVASVTSWWLIIFCFRNDSYDCLFAHSFGSVKPVWSTFLIKQQMRIIQKCLKSDEFIEMQRCSGFQWSSQSGQQRK